MTSWIIIAKVWFAAAPNSLRLPSGRTEALPASFSADIAPNCIAPHIHHWIPKP